MTVNELLANVTELQGNRVMLQCWSNLKQATTLLRELFEVPGDAPERDEYEITYIFADGEDLVIEVCGDTDEVLEEFKK
ncbi:MAG: hypothetical protein E7449_01110 [Ruminococcaceae bacterium]|nr:hypothetical protein [Oscillospiraceae bacterium]